jgi:hypothetical protein
MSVGQTANGSVSQRVDLNDLDPRQGVSPGSHNADSIGCARCRRRLMASQSRDQTQLIRYCPAMTSSPTSAPLSRAPQRLGHIDEAKTKGADSGTVERQCQSQNGFGQGVVRKEEDANDRA